MTNKTEVTAKQAAEQLQKLLAEKVEVEVQIDKITSVKRIINSDADKGYEPKIMSTRVVAHYGCGDSTFNIDASILAEAAQTMLDKHAKRLDEINDSLLFMVKLIK